MRISLTLQRLPAGWPCAAALVLALLGLQESGMALRRVIVPCSRQAGCVQCTSRCQDVDAESILRRPQGLKRCRNSASAVCLLHSTWPGCLHALCKNITVYCVRRKCLTILLRQNSASRPVLQRPHELCVLTRDGDSKQHQGEHHEYLVAGLKFRTL